MRFSRTSATQDIDVDGSFQLAIAEERYTDASKRARHLIATNQVSSEMERIWLSAWANA